LFITLSSNAQVNSTTGDLINSGTSPTATTSTWNNGVYVNQLCFGAGQPGNCGPNPSVRPGGYINFSYGTADLNQVVNINKALESAGNGVQLSGFNFSFTAKNGNGWDDARQDYLAAYVKLYNAGGGLAANYDYSAQTNRKYNWSNFSFNETFANPVAASQYSNAQVGFVGRDNNFWAGNYGPEIFNVSFSLKYRVDPCATNPAYSSTCSGFNNVINSPNLFNSSLGGGSMNQAFAINTALGLAGSGATVHGINYGFNYTVGQGFSGCTATNQDGSCSWYMNTPAYANAAFSLTNSNNQTIYQKNHSFTQEGTSGSVSEKYLLSSSMNQTLLGTARLTASSSGTGSSVSGAWANIIYTADPCAVNPLSSPNCSGYGAAFAKNLASTTSTTSPAPTTLSLLNTPMDNSGPLVSDGSFGATSPVPGAIQGSTPPPGSEPTASSNGATPPPGSPPPPGAAPGPAQGPGPTATATASAGPAQRQESGGKSSSGPSSLAMSVVSRVQAADKATQNASVANAQQVVATSSSAAQAQANQVVEQANALSAESSQASQTITASTMQQGSMQQQGNATTPGSLQGPVATSVQTLSSLAQQSSASTTTQYGVQTITQTGEVAQAQSQGLQGLPLQQPQQIQFTQPTMPAYQPPVVASVENNSMYSLTAGAMIRPSQGINLNSQANTVSIAMITPQMLQQHQEFKFETRTEQEQPQVFQQPQTAMTRGSILNDIIEQRVNVASFQMEQQMDTVKKNVLPNELAGGVDIASMAMVPKGYETYSIVTLRDVPFYKPEAIYKDNKTVDNARVLRGLTGGSDAKHQEMVNQQYKLGE